jgi:hypothetical protein
MSEDKSEVRGQKSEALPFFCYDQRYGLSIEDDSRPGAQALINELAAFFREQPGSLDAEFAMRISGRFFNRVLDAGLGPSSIAYARDSNGMAIMPPGSTSEELPLHGVVEKEVPGEVKREALAAMQNQGIPDMSEFREKARRLMLAPEQAFAPQAVSAGHRNLERFLSFIAHTDKGCFDALTDLGRLKPPSRYQAWGETANGELPLWSNGTCGGNLERMNRNVSCGDRIELIDRIGIVPDAGVLTNKGLMQVLEADDAFRLVTHNLVNYGHRTLAFRHLAATGGVKLTGPARLLVSPRSTVPHLQSRYFFKGQYFVEGWRLVL